MSDQCTTPSLQSVLDAARGQISATGAAVALCHTGHNPLLLASGHGTTASAQPLPVRARFRIGSITKLFTASTILHLAERGAFSVHDPVSAWVPTLPYATSITIDHALRHTSGLFNYTQSPDFLARVSQQCSPWAPEELLAYATLENQCFLPGTDWIYSNTNYILLGLIIEQVLGASLADVFQNVVFGPCGMTSSLLDGGVTLPDGCVRGYAPAPPTDQALDMTDLLPLSTAWAAGATVSTTADLLAFSGHLFTGSLLQPATRAAMLTCRPTRDPLFPGVQGYGAGVVCMALGGETAYGHLGNIPGYSGLLAYLPRHDLHLAVLLNQDYFPVTPTSLNVQVLATAILEVVLA